MEVVRDDVELDVEHREVEREVGAEGAVGRLGVEVAEVRREERLAAARDAERALQLGARGDDRPGGARERQRGGRVPARAAERERGAHDGVLAAAVDRPVVREEGVGDPAEPRPRLVVVEGDRLVGEVPARQHERAAEVGREQVVERRVREHDAEPRASRARPTSATAAPSRRRRSTIGRARRAEQRPLLVARPRRAPPGAAVISANGFSSRCLRARSRATASSFARVAGEVVAAEALDREDRARRGACDTASSSGIDSRGPQTGQAIGSAWKRRSAGSSYSRRQSAHIGKPAIVVVGAVVGDGPHDREAWPALRAVQERVAVAAVGRVEELAQAVVAGGDVGRDRGRAARRQARPRS